MAELQELNRYKFIFLCAIISQLMFGVNLKLDLLWHKVLAHQGR
jgi:hypothetical protein